jgi:hypothetical protein
VKARRYAQKRSTPRWPPCSCVGAGTSLSGLVFLRGYTDGILHKLNLQLHYHAERGNEMRVAALPCRARVRGAECESEALCAKTQHTTLAPMLLRGGGHFPLGPCIPAWVHRWNTAQAQSPTALPRGAWEREVARRNEEAALPRGAWERDESDCSAGTRSGAGLDNPDSVTFAYC